MSEPPRPSRGEPDPATPPPHEVTSLLEAVSAGDVDSRDRLIEVVYGELRSIARGRIARERAGHTLQADDLVHEAYFRLVGDLSARPMTGRAQFFHAAADAMRRILIEYARRRSREKRGGGNAREFLDVADLAASDPDDTLSLVDAIDRLQEFDARLAETVRLRYFAGLSVEETAAVLGSSTRTVKRDWSFARAWLYDALGGAGETPSERG